MAAVAFAALAVSAISAAVAAAGRGGNFGFGTSGNDRIRIPDEAEGGGVLSKIKVPRSEKGRIADIDVRLRIRHGSDEDLNIYLVSPTGKFVELSTDNGGDGNDYGGGALGCNGPATTFKDEAGRSIRAGAAPFAGGYRPQSRLSQLDGDRAAGTWRLQVFDDEAGTAGTLGCWQFRIGLR